MRLLLEFKQLLAILQTDMKFFHIKLHTDSMKKSYKKAKRFRAVNRNFGYLFRQYFCLFSGEVSRFILVAILFILLHSGTRGPYQLPEIMNHQSPACYGAENLRSFPGQSAYFSKEGNTGEIREDQGKTFPADELNGTFTLEKYIIDTVIYEGDGQALADVNGDGNNNLIVGTGNGGEVYWYEKISSGKWERHLIAEGYREVEGTIAGDFNGNGKTEVIILDQRGNRVDIAIQANDNPGGDWLTFTLDPDANLVQQGLIMDVTGNGYPDFIYAYEGSHPGNGGFYWMENKVGDLLNPGNWEKHEIKQIEGAWWIDYNSPRDWGGSGTGDIAVGVREIRGRNPGSVNGGIYILKQTGNPRDIWIMEAVDTSFPVLQVSSGDLTGNGDERDLVAGACHDSEHTGLYIFDYSNKWQRAEVEIRHNWWGTYAFDINKNGRAEIISGESSGNTLRIYAYCDKQTRYVLQISDPFLKPDDQIIFEDIDGNGHKTEFFVGSDPDGVFWYRAFRIQ